MISSGRVRAAWDSGHGVPCPYGVLALPLAPSQFWEGEKRSQVDRAGVGKLVLVGAGGEGEGTRAFGDRGLAQELELLGF